MLRGPWKLYNALAREAVWIKETDPNERINNKEEYHQPGDVEVSYTRNDNKMTKKTQPTLQKPELLTIVEEDDDDKSDEYQQRKITEFLIQKIRRESDTEKLLEETAVDAENVNHENDIMEEEPLSTQELIQDARERRSLKMNGKPEIMKCDQCQYTSGSNMLLKNHIEASHKEMRKRLACEVCAFKTTSEVVMKTHVKLNHERKQPNAQNNSKRKVCEICAKRFNKKATYEHHMKSAHSQNTIQEGQAKVKK